MMQLGFARRYNFIVYSLREWNINELIAVDVAQLTLANAIFGAAKAVRMRLHLRPAQDGLVNFLRCTGNGH